MGGARVLLLGVLAAGSLAACSSSLSSSKSDASRDATGAVDRPAVDRMADATGGADRHDAAADRQGGGAGCSPLDTSVWPVSQCAATWAEVVGYPQCVEQSSSQRIRIDCGDTHSVTQFGGDSNVTCWYDGSSGALLAVSGIFNFSQKCWGPSGWIAPNCPNAIATTLCPNDGGVPADGGAGNCLAESPLPGLTWNEACAVNALCYADCVVTRTKYVGCVSGSSTATQCYSSCSECP
jgi:hypothetical protein